MTTFYHGTSLGAGLQDGDWLDPSKGHFEPCVWGTASEDLARRWARACDVTYGAGEIVFRLDLDGARILHVDDPEFDDYAGAAADGYDAIVYAQGEDGVSTIAIIRDRAVRAMVS